MANKKVPINYYSRDFNSIKESLLQHVRRYYPDSYKDFGEAGFGSLMLDTVSYVGDVLSFYLDYQANESFLDTANETKNIINIARQMGYRQKLAPSSQGVVSFYAYIPANSVGNDLDYRYLPTIRQGTTLRSESGVNFILAEDVVFKPTNSNVRVGLRDESGTVTYYIIKQEGSVVSGEFQNITVNVGDFQEFLRIEIPQANISEIISVLDAQGNEYFEVNHLTQDILYRPLYNSKDPRSSKAMLRPFSVPRRFVVDVVDNLLYLQFGQGREQNEEIQNQIVDPSQKVLKLYGKNYYSAESFDPVNLVESDKFGIVPYNTTLQISVRTNSITQINIGTDQVNTIVSPILEFEDRSFLDTDILSFITTNLEVTNEEPILGRVESETPEEIKIRSSGIFSSQNRAVTLEDYESIVYSMPNQFGSIKRVSVIKDLNSFKRNLNIYVLSEDENGFFINTNSLIKENLRIWLNKYKILNDTIDILDAKILNIGIDFEILVNMESNKYEVVESAKNSISELYSVKPQIGQPIFINDIIEAIKTTPGVLDVVSVNVVPKVGGDYSNLFLDLEQNLSEDGRFIQIPDNVAFEIKLPANDIKGVVL
jgi:hypothetical protein